MGRKGYEEREKAVAGSDQFYHKGNCRCRAYFFDQFLFRRAGEQSPCGRECAYVFDIRIAWNTWGLYALWDSVVVNFGEISQKRVK